MRESFVKFRRDDQLITSNVLCQHIERLISRQRIGAVENMSVEATPPPGIIDLPEQFKREVEKLKKFQNFINLLTVLADIEAFEVRHVAVDGKKKICLIFAEPLPKTAQS